MAATSGIHTAPPTPSKCSWPAPMSRRMCSALLRNGISHIREIETKMCEWMEEHDYQSVQQLQGSMSQKYCSIRPPSNAPDMRACSPTKPPRSLSAGNARSHAGVLSRPEEIIPWML